MHLDDPSHLDHNPLFQPLSLSRFPDFFSSQPHGIYMPLTYSAWAIVGMVAERPAALIEEKAATGVPRNYRFDPLLFHLLCLGLHLLSVGLVFRIVRELVASDIAATLATALFALHPLQVEPVAWISALKDTLSTSLALGAVWFLLVASKTANKAQALQLAFFLYMLALLSKPTVVFLPFALAPILWASGRWQVATLAKTLAPFATLAVLFACFGAADQNIGAHQFVPPEWAQRPCVAFDAIWFYAKKLVFPAPLILDYGHAPNQVLSAPDLRLNVALGLLVSAAALGFFLIPRFRLFAAGLLFFLAALLPTSGLKPFYHQTISTVADRYVYFGLFGLSLSAAVVLRWLSKRWPRGIVVLGTGTAVLLAGLSFVQAGKWQNGESLFAHTLRYNAGSWLAHNNLGSFYERENRLRDALTHYQAGAQLRPSSLLFNNIGAVALALNDPAIAESAFRQGLAIDPTAVPNRHGMALALSAQGKNAEAQQALRDILRQNPGFEPALSLLRKLASTTDK